LWSIILLIQSTRFRLETAAVTFIVGVLIIASLALHKGWRWERAEPSIRLSLPALVFRTCLVILFLLPLAAVTFSLVPLNEGLEAPGFTASVEPMVQLPPQYHHPSAGSFILTTVIPQTPILTGEWLYAHLDRSVKLVSQEEIVPRTETAQSVSRGDYRMLLDSKTTAIIVGLRLAGYPVETKNDGVGVVSILDASPAIGILQPDDIITGLNGNPVLSVADLTGQLQLSAPGSFLNLEINRQGQKMDITVTVMDPVEAGGPVRIGISVVQHNSGFSLPFPVDIIPQKVDGGPSAGLMFTLGVYDLLTDQDLTGGRIIAGTGTIDLDGNVGTIGGVQQKVVAAERAGAEYFLSPPENYPDALAIAGNITVVEIATAQDAIDFLLGLSPLTTD